MFNTSSSSFYGCGYKVKKALKFTVTSVPALKALRPMKKMARIFHNFQENESKKEKECHHSNTAHSFCHGPGSSVMQLLGSTRAPDLPPLGLKQPTNPVIFELE